MVRSDLTGDTPRVADLRLHKFRVEIFDRRELQPEIVSPSIDQANLPAEHHGTESALRPEGRNPSMLLVKKSPTVQNAAMEHEHLIGAVSGFNRVDPKFMEVGD
jgi:hypothetical protein